MSDFLDTMAKASAARAASLMVRPGESALRAMASSAGQPIPLTLESEGFDLIAEVKLASPSEGTLAEGGGVDLVTELASSYASAGAAAISVLTEPSRFSGAIDHLMAVSALRLVPVLRKDFLVDPVQVVEARAAGASGVLLIARLFSRQLLAEMTDTAAGLGMFVLVEVFEEDDLDIASAVFDRQVLVGVNARDLATLQVDPDRLARLGPKLPSHVPTVAESGIDSPEEAARVAGLGYRLALVGTSLVRSGDPAGSARAMIEAGRAALVGVS